MPTKPFSVKQIAKEKETQAEKLLTKEPLKDNLDTKVHKDQKDQKDQKESKEQKEHKEQKEQKEHKEKLEKEKHEHKEVSKEHLPVEKFKEEQLEKLPESVLPAQPEASALSAQAAASAQGIAKLVEHKFQKEKIEKIEKEKFEKIEKIEKVEHKEIEKFSEIFQDPGGPVESRLAALEASVAQLMHFIPANLRPDLSQGALKQEPDVTAAAEAPPAGDAPHPPAGHAEGTNKPGETKKDDKKK